MIAFWIAAALLLLIALAFVLVPLWYKGRLQAEEDRTALNVALYQERVAALEAQHQAGTLTAQHMEQARLEAAKELLADTENAEQPVASRRLGLAVPVCTAILVPLLGLGMYLHWGASDKLQLAYEFEHDPRSMDEMVQRLERAVQAQPESVQSWYFLARTYMTQGRAAEAEKAFEYTAALSGRPAEVLGQWAQAVYFASSNQLTPQVQALTSEALQKDPHEVTSLGLLGIAAFETERYAEAITYWERMIASLPADDPSRAAVQSGIDQARTLLEGEGKAEPEAQTSATDQQGLTLTIEVSIAESAQKSVQPSDTVFVFARALDRNGPPLPLAAKRLTASELPTTVVLTDADAMMPQMKLSGFPRIEVVARVSRTGEVSHGEWIGRTEPIETAESQPPIDLIIDQPELR